MAAPDPFQPSSSTRKIGENKLLTARARASPYLKPGAQGVNKGKINTYGKCIDCKVRELLIDV
jgi:cysteine-rich PDZ-binding protein